MELRCHFLASQSPFIAVDTPERNSQCQLQNVTRIRGWNFKLFMQQTSNPNNLYLLMSCTQIASLCAIAMAGRQLGIVQEGVISLSVARGSAVVADSQYLYLFIFHQGFQFYLQYLSVVSYTSQYRINPIQLLISRALWTHCSIE